MKLYIIIIMGVKHQVTYLLTVLPSLQGNKNTAVASWTNAARIDASGDNKGGLWNTTAII